MAEAPMCGPAIVRKTEIPAPRITQDTFLVLEDRVQLPRVYYGWQSAKAFAPDDAPLTLLGSILGQGTAIVDEGRARAAQQPRIVKSQSQGPCHLEGSIAETSIISGPGCSA